jgi:hypothetical protein
MKEKKQAGADRRAGSAATEPDVEGTPNRLGGHSPAKNAQEAKPGRERGAEPGAHGDRPPHPDVKPGTALDLEKETDR